MAQQMTFDEVARELGFSPSLMTANDTRLVEWVIAARSLSMSRASTFVPLTDSRRRYNIAT
jgi:DNA-binding transcriptional regulator GbsR (MarR family)